LDALLITDLVGSVIVIAGFVFGALRFGRRIIRAVEGWIKRVGDNTAATESLTEVVSEIRDDIREVVATLRQHGERLDNHEGRISRIEGSGKGGPGGTG